MLSRLWTTFLRTRNVLVGTKVRFLLQIGNFFFSNQKYVLTSREETWSLIAYKIFETKLPEGWWKIKAEDGKFRVFRWILKSRLLSQSCTGLSDYYGFSAKGSEKLYSSTSKYLANRNGYVYVFMNRVCQQCTIHGGAFTGTGYLKIPFKKNVKSAETSRSWLWKKRLYNFGNPFFSLVGKNYKKF